MSVVPKTQRLPKSVFEFDDAYEQLLTQYRAKRSPVVVNFRHLVPMNSGVDRATHLFHPYPAKLLLNIPYFFLRCSATSKKARVVVDPFCGSGTVLVESLLAGKKAYGADSNPLARLITSAKTTPIKQSIIDKVVRRLAATRAKAVPPRGVGQLDTSYWFSERVARDIQGLVQIVVSVRSAHTRTFLMACLSVCLRRCSYADPRVSVPVKLAPARRTRGSELRESAELKLKWLKKVDVRAEFLRIVRLNARRLQTLKDVRNGNVFNIANDARGLLKSMGSVKADLVITSPPYVGAQKYVRASSLSLCMLDMIAGRPLREIEMTSIGREHFSTSEYTKFMKTGVREADLLLREIYTEYPLRAHIASTYLIEMRHSLKEVYRVMRNGAALVLVVGTNTVCGRFFDTRQYLLRICESVGFKKELILVDDIRSRGLMTKRNKTASVIASEWVMVLRKADAR